MNKPTQRIPAAWRKRLAGVAVIAACLLPGPAMRAQIASMTLEWDPSPSPGVIGYRVYVGHEPEVYFATFDIPDQTTFVFAGAEVGALYYFAVAARGPSGEISARSNEVSGIAQAIGTLPEFEPPDTFERQGAIETRARPPSPRCTAAQCPAPAIVASGTGSITAMAAALDGRLLYVEDGRMVRVAGPGATPVALEIERAERTLDGLAIDPDFARTGFVFLAESVQRPDATRELRIVRYRELGGTLGEGAAIAAGLPAAEGAASIAVDSGANVFAALGTGVGGSDPYAGHLLAFSADGRTRPGDGPAAPVIAAAGARPAGLFWDPAGSRLWWAELERQTLTRVDLPATQRPIARAVALPLPFRVTSAAFARSGEILAAVLTSDTGRLYQATLDESFRLGTLEELALPGAGQPVAVAITPQQEVYVALQDGERWTIAVMR